MLRRRFRRLLDRGERTLPLGLRFHRLRPVSRCFGFDRGRPLDRHYIDGFLERNRTLISGCVLEVGDPGYTRRFGGAQVTHSEVLHANPGNPVATLVADLAAKQSTLPADKYDCIIMTQVYPFVYDARTAIHNTYDALRPGGTLLATLPGISQISRYDMERWGDFWRFTDLSAHRLMEEVFPADHVEIETHGNVMIACALMHGIPQEEVPPAYFDYQDPDFQVIITVKAQKPFAAAASF